MSERVGVEQTPDIEAVLAEHEDRTFDPALHGRRCSCGWGNDDFRHTDVEFHAHVAQALTPVLDAAVREARAAELRDAADDYEAEVCLKHSGTGSWLRDRADRIAVDAPTTDTGARDE